MPELYDINGNQVASQAVSTTHSFLTNPKDIQDYTRKSAIKNGVDPSLALAVAKQESSFNPNAESKAGAQGIFQLMPETQKTYGVTDPFDAKQNIDAGTKYLAELQKQYKGDRYKTLVHYNSGPGNVNKPFEQLPDETQGYLTNILGENVATTHGSTKEIYDINGNPLDVTKSPFYQQPPSQQQVQAIRGLNKTYTGLPYYIQRSKEYAPLVLGALGGAAGEMVGLSNVGAGVGSAAGELLASPGVPNEEDWKRALEAGLTTAGIGKAFGVPGGLKKQIEKSLVTKAEKASNILESARQDIAGGIPSGEIKGAQNVLEAKLAPVKEQENADWEKVNSRLDKASHVFDVPTGEVDPTTNTPITKPTTIRAPIKISTSSQDYINNELSRLKPLIDSHLASRKELNTYQLLTNASSAIIKDNKGDAYLPFDTVKPLRTDIGKNVAQEKQTNLTVPGNSIGVQNAARIQSGVRNTLGDDIESSLLDEDPTGKLLGDYGSAVGMTKTRVKASVLDKILDKRTNQANGMLDVDGAINDIMKGTSKGSTQFTGAEKKTIVDALQAVKNVSPQYDGGLKLSNGQWLFSSYYATRHPLKFAVSVATKDLFEKALENPKYARIIAQLPSAPSKSSQANIMTRSFFKNALKSIPAEMIAPSGMKIKAHIDENGNPTPDYNFQNQPGIALVH